VNAILALLPVPETTETRIVDVLTKFSSLPARVDPLLAETITVFAAELAAA
jgi:hypothetical protein